MPPQELVKYTFEALEAWAIDRQAAREENETPTRVSQPRRPEDADPLQKPSGTQRSVSQHDL